MQIRDRNGLGRGLLAASVIAIACVGPASGAGPAGHFLLSRKSIQSIQSGRGQAPNELRRLLTDPECRRAYGGGAIGPDICESASHYNNTGDLARRLLETARQHMKDAAAERDEAAFKRSRLEMAFAYGWLNHCATDLDVHPVVNGRVGDTYRYVDKGGKLKHGALEAQLTAYLQQAIGKQRYDVHVPYEFLASVTGIPEATLRQHGGVLNAKAAAELAAAGKVTLTPAQLTALWGDAVRGALNDTETITRTPEALQNWDLDCGRISTADFDAFRRDMIAFNGGKLPAGWGRNYLAWWAQIKDLSREARADKMRSLLGKPAVATGGATGGAGSATGRRVLDILSRCDLVDVSVYGHITETGAKNRDYRENIAIASSSSIEPLDRAARVKFSGNSFSVSAEGQVTTSTGRVERGRISITGSVSADGKTANVQAETYSIEEGSFDSTRYLTFSGVPLDTAFLNEKQGEDIVRFQANGKGVPGMVGRAEMVFRYLNSDGTVKNNGVHRRVMDFKGDTTEPQVAIYLSRRR